MGAQLFIHAPQGLLVAPCLCAQVCHHVLWAPPAAEEPLHQQVLVQQGEEGGAPSARHALCVLVQHIPQGLDQGSEGCSLLGASLCCSSSCLLHSSSKGRHAHLQLPWRH